MKPGNLNIPSRIETRRLYLRCYSLDDSSWYYLMSQRNRVHLVRYELGNPVLSINRESDASRVLDEFARCWNACEAFFMGAFLYETGEFVAQIYIGVVTWELPEFEIGYFAEVDHQGMGYVSEGVRGALNLCFDHLKAHRVRLETDDTNLPSICVAEKCGLIREGHIRQNKLNPDGTISGTLHYGLLRSEYNLSE